MSTIILIKKELSIRLEVYIDVLFAVNFAMDFFILWSVSVIGVIDTNIKKIILASAIGSFLYCAIIFISKYYMYRNIAACFIILSVMTLIAFRPKGLKDFIKNQIFTYVTAMVLGGICYWLYNFVSDGRFSFKILIISSFSVYIAIKFGIGYIDRHITKRRCFCRIDVFINGLRIPLTALIDTGSSLKGPIKGEPVIMAEVTTVKRYLKCAVSENRLVSIPFKSLGAENASVYGIYADYAEAMGSNICPVILGLYSGHFSSGEYDAIVSPNIFKEGDYYETA